MPQNPLDALRSWDCDERSGLSEVSSTVDDGLSTGDLILRDAEAACGGADDILF
jgi:hypothetical protein